MSTTRFPQGAFLLCLLIAALGATVLVEAEAVELTRKADRLTAEGDALRLELAKSAPIGSATSVVERPAPAGAKGDSAPPASATGDSAKSLAEGDAATSLAKDLAKAKKNSESSVRLRGEAESIRSRRLPLIVGITPVLALLLALFVPGSLEALRTWSPLRVAGLGAGLSVWLLLLTSHGWLTAKGFDLYVPTILAGVAFAAILTPKDEIPGRLSAAGFAVWLLLWIPFDLRWYSSIWLGSPGLEYTCFGLLVALIAILGFACVGKLDTVGVRRPKASDLKPALILCGVVAVVLIPIGLGTGFLKLTSAQFGLGGAALGFLGLALTVALPEELFFRGILDAGLQKHLGRWGSLALSSFLFGLMHWNNVGSLEERLLYLLLATLAGALYGAAFRTSRGLAAPVLLHTLVDLVWQAFLGG